MNEVLFAFGLTLFAGLATGIGSLIAFFAKQTSTKFLSVSLGFSAGVMIYVSMIEIFAKAQEALSTALGNSMGRWVTVGGFFGGMLVIGIIDKLVPEGENPHEFYNDDDEELMAIRRGEILACSIKDRKLMRMGVFTALAIAIHNFPEGLATFISALQAPNIAMAVAIAIAIHNIPEGIAVSVPVYYACKDRKKAFLYSFFSGLSEPIGAIVGYLILRPFINDMVFGIIFAMVAGIMVFISIDELLPSAREYGEHHLSIYGMVAGMAVMAVSLLLFG